MTLRSGAALLAVALLSLLAAGAARAADSIYWIQAQGNKISHANLAGGGGADIPIVGAEVDAPSGLAIDPAAGKIYWANLNKDTIDFANLDGSGGGQVNTAGANTDEPESVAIDPLAGRLYWANSNLDVIAFAKLDGSGVGQLDTAGATISEAIGLAIDTGQGRIYWANRDSDSISFAKLDGSAGAGNLDVTGAPIGGPSGVVIDDATNTIYWTNVRGDTIGFASLNGGGGGKLDTTGAPIHEPTGLALDPEAGRVYWTNAGGAIGYANLHGGGGGSLDTTGAGSGGKPSLPVLLEKPLAGHPPSAVTKAQPRHAPALRPGTKLSCTQGVTWAPDLLASLLYRAPQSFAYQWMRNGSPIPGATANDLAAPLVGTYTCQVTATNFVGSTSQTSAPIPIAATIKIGKARLNRRRGTGILPVTVTGTGKVTVAGKRLVTRQRSRASGAVKLALIATGRAKKTLFAKGRLRVKAVVTYTPAGGKTLRRKVTFVLKRR